MPTTLTNFFPTLTEPARERAFFPTAGVNAAAKRGTDRATFREALRESRSHEPRPTERQPQSKLRAKQAQEPADRAMDAQNDRAESAPVAASPLQEPATHGSSDAASSGETTAVAGDGAASAPTTAAPPPVALASTPVIAPAITTAEPTLRAPIPTPPIATTGEVQAANIGDATPAVASQPAQGTTANQTVVPTVRTQATPIVPQELSNGATRNAAAPTVAIEAGVPQRVEPAKRDDRSVPRGEATGAETRQVEPPPVEARRADVPQPERNEAASSNIEVRHAADRQLAAARADRRVELNAAAARAHSTAAQSPNVEERTAPTRTQPTATQGPSTADQILSVKLASNQRAPSDARAAGVNEAVQFTHGAQSGGSVEGSAPNHTNHATATPSPAMNGLAAGLGTDGAATLDASLREAVEDPKAAERIVRGMATLVNANGGAMKMRLQPPELGDLRVQMSVVRGVVSAHFQASTPEAQAMIERNMTVLRQALEQHGLTVERLTVHTPQTSHSSFMSSDRGDQQQSSQQHDAGDGRSKGFNEQSSKDDRSSSRRFSFDPFMMDMSELATSATGGNENS